MRFPNREGIGMSRKRIPFIGGILFGCVLVSCALLPASLAACIDYENYLHSIGGIDTDLATNAVEAGGGLLLLTEGTWLRVYDLTDPVAPAARGAVDLGSPANDIAMEGPLVCAAMGYSGLRIVDISDPDAPALRGAVTYTGLTLSVAVEGTLACLASLDGFYTIDISNPDAPVILCRLQQVWCRHIAMSGSLAFVASGAAGLLVLDVSDPTAPAVIGSLSTGGYTRHIELDGTIAWIADDAAGLVAVDVTDPSAPLIAGGLPLEDPAEALAADAGLVFAAAGNGGLYSIDSSNPSAPALIGKIGPLQYARDVVRSGDHVYFADYHARIVDVSSPASPLVVATLDTPGDLLDVRLRGDLAILADGPAGVEVVNIADPQHPVLLGGVETPGACQDLDLLGEFAFVADDNAGVQVIDLRNPGAPAIAATIPLEDATAVDVDGSLLYVANGWYGLEIIDATDPLNPLGVGDLHIPALGLIKDVDASGSLAILIDKYDRTLIFVDVSNPAAPSLLAERSVPADPTAVRIRGSYAYVTTATGYLEVFSIADPSSPALVGSVTAAKTATDLAFFNQIAYLMAGTGGLEVFDISDPVTPVLLGGVDTQAQAFRIAPAADYVYVADRSGGLVILPAQCTMTGGAGELGRLYADRLLAAPNPSAGPTRLRIDLTKAGRISVVLYDIAGRRIRRIDGGWTAAGTRDLYWDGNDDSDRPVAPGVYLWRLEGGRARGKTFAIVR